MYNKARATLDDDERNELIGQLQEMLYEDGGYIVWGFFNQADAYQNYVGGTMTYRTGMPASGFQFRHLWIAQESE
ncbi:hypothetical protein [Kocuria atrinae]|uniref:hypothetical protein n=1 Tax=Kocuria atrinae TaxID=592377 RepID=UPI001CB9BF46|nr:hypothetical protein [Kocuria atrinae]